MTTLSNPSAAVHAAPNSFPLEGGESAFSWKDFLSSFLLVELFKGMALTRSEERRVGKEC